MKSGRACRECQEWWAIGLWLGFLGLVLLVGLYAVERYLTAGLPSLVAAKARVRGGIPMLGAAASAPPGLGVGPQPMPLAAGLRFFSGDRDHILKAHGISRDR